MFMQKQIIGRKEEIHLLDRLYRSQNAEFLAVYGRRRIGKTFLITQFFKDKGIFFEITGAPNTTTTEQLINFHDEFCALFTSEAIIKTPKNWSEAFRRLREALKKINPSQKIILFFDELPWLATARSQFLAALDYNWNRHFSRMPNVLLIVCGSAASWMVNQIVNNKGGLYGRLSAHLRLLPFTFSETEEYLQSRGINLPRTQICELYMVTGGVPKYLSYLEQGLSATQCIHSLCFTPQAPLLTEFHKLYHSLFRHPEPHLKIVSALANRRRGLLRSELLKEAQLKDSGRASEILNELLESGFLMMMPQIGKQVREARYYLSDEYSLFYFNWIDPVKSTLLHGVDKDYWITRQNSQAWRIWVGYAFETLCLKHIDKIKNALGISAVSTTSGYWKSVVEGKKESEIDLVIDRADQCINLCEIKFHAESYEMDAAYAKELLRKKELFRKRTKTRKALFTTLITTYGATKNSAYLSSVDNQLTLDQLF